MATKQYLFDELPEVSLTLDLEYTYYHLPAKTNCRNDDAHPEEEESSITLPHGWEDEVMSAYIQAARYAIRKIELDLIPDMEFHNMPRRWAEEEREC